MPNDFSISKRLPSIMGAGFQFHFLAKHEKGRAVGVIEVKDGFGKTCGGELDAGTIDKLIVRLGELRDTVRALNQAKTIVVGLDKTPDPPAAPLKEQMEKQAESWWSKWFGDKSPAKKPKRDNRPGGFEPPREGFEGDGTRDEDE